MHVIEADEAGTVTPPPSFADLEETGEKNRTAAYLDQVIPLKGASHADVVSYSVEVPMRYAECFATLRDGRKVRLAERRRFVGWSGDADKRALLFRKNLLHIELQTEKGLNGSARGPGGISDIVFESAVRTIRTADQPQQDAERKFIGVDGSLVCLPGRRMGRISSEFQTRQ